MAGTTNQPLEKRGSAKPLEFTERKLCFLFFRIWFCRCVPRVGGLERVNASLSTFTHLVT